MVRLFLGIASLMLLWTFNSSSSAQTKEPTLPDGRWPRQVSGVGETEESARQDAFKQAVKTVNVLMHQQEPPLQAFVVTTDYVRKHLLVDKGAVGKDIAIKGIENPFKQWVLTFRTDYNWWKDIVHHDQEAERQSRAEARQTLAARLVLGLSALLLAAFGYVRLDRFTRGRYTTWLRLASAGVASLVLAGLLWTLRGG